MLMAPRLIEALAQELEHEPLLADGRAIPGGIWRDVIPQDERLRTPLPAIVFAFIAGLPNAGDPQAFDLTVEARGEIEGTSVQDIREAMDHADVCLRRAERNAPGVHVDGMKFSAGKKTAEILRTTVEVGRLYAHLGGQYTYTCREPALREQ
jgi:hypothetical protein